MRAYPLFSPTTLRAARFWLVLFSLVRPASSGAAEDPLAAGRAAPAFQAAPAVPQPTFSAQPSVEEISRARVFEEVLAPSTGVLPTPAENLALSKALADYSHDAVAKGPQSAAADLSPVENFLAAYPHSAWRISLLTNLGIEYYKRAMFTPALAAWQGAWEAGQAETSPQVVPVVDRAVAELARMNGRLGRVSDLQALLAQVGNRPLQGTPFNIFNDAKGGLADMRNHPGDCFKCGPWALHSIATLQGTGDRVYPTIHDYASTDHGTSLTQVAALAATLKLDLHPVHREGAATVPVPAVVHWKLGHYGALLRRDDAGRYLLKDPTFGTTEWISQAVLDQESSGYFLIAGTTPPAGWRAVPAEEGQEVWGKGKPTGYGAGGCTGGDGSKPKPKNKPKKGPGGPPKKKCHGMADWNMHLSVCSLNLTDCPVGYLPPVGPSIFFNVNYDQREDNQPSTFSYANLGAGWNFDWVTTLTFDSDNGYVNNGSGGIDIFPNFTSSTPTSSPGEISLTYLVRVNSSTYQEVFPDGSLSVFGLSDASGRYYLTAIVDECGNTVHLGYDSQYRLITVTDAVGQVSTLTYGLAADPLKITKITDPFGRTAQFTYNSSNQLIEITDAVGMTSQFAYGSGSFIQSLTTGYGTTTFSSTDSGLDRTLIVTNPDGSQEECQSLTDASPTIGDSEPVAPANMSLENEYLEFRNTFYWDRKAMLEAPGDLTKAQIFHFCHTDGQLKGRVLESMKMPLENRVWYFHQNQSSPFVDNSGELDNETQTGRVLDDGSTQLDQSAYDTLGNRIQHIDPVGRTTNMTYATNGIDLVQISQMTKAGTASDVLATFTYNAQHSPVAVTDASGRVTRQTYNAAGQLTTVTDSKGNVTTYTYDEGGHLTKVSGPQAGVGGTTTMTYDSVGRVHTSTNALGYSVTYAYDNLDRLTQVTFPDNTTQKIAYRLLDIQQTTDRLGHTYKYTYDPFSQVTSMTDPSGQVTNIVHCRCGAISSVIDALGQTLRYNYDVQGRAISKVYPDGSQVTTQYEATTSRPKVITDARGQTLTYTYNVDDSIALVANSNTAGGTPVVQFTYDQSYRRIAAMQDGNGTTSYVYNPVAATATLGADQLAAIKSPQGEVDYAYDELGRVNAWTFAGQSEYIEFDALGRKKTVTNALGTFDFSYNADTWQPTSMGYPNGQSSHYTFFGPTQDIRLAQIQHLRAGGAVLSQWSYTYDDEGNLATWTQQRDSSTPRGWTPGYDANERLRSVALTNPTATAGYTYDPVGNRLTETLNGATTSATYNSRDEIQNVTPPPESDRTYEWDGNNRVTAINYPATGTRTEFTYDAYGRRVRIVEKTGTTINSIKQYLWNRFDLVAELDGNGNVTKRYFTDGVQLVSGANPGSYYYTTDHLGSIREMTDVTGAIRARYDYDAFGRRTKLTGDLDTDLGFDGYYTHVPSGLEFAALRAYDPNLGRWISRDPLEEEGGVNPYAFVLDQPMGSVDANGLDSGSAFKTGSLSSWTSSTF